MRHLRTLPLTCGVGAILLANACTETSTAPNEMGKVRAPDELAQGERAGDAATVTWNGIARQLLADRLVVAPHLQLRLLAYLSVAQYNALIAAERAREQGRRAATPAAIGGASVAVLTSFFPDDASFLETTLDQHLAVEDHARTTAFKRGERIGRTVGAKVLAYAATDEFEVLIPPDPPVGPGYWTATPDAPLVRALYGTRPFTLRSPAQFRPAPPPSFGSPTFLSALAEIRSLSETRTPEQLASVQLWAGRVAAYWNGLAVEFLESNDAGERRAARILAIANMAAFDAMIACWDAKFEYWFIRPYQADPAITLPLGVPNHPSYTSGHACNSASFATVLAHFFPGQAARLDELVDEAGLSRMYAGLHYQFDLEAGQDIGRAVAVYTIRQSPRGHRPISLD